MAKFGVLFAIIAGVLVATVALSFSSLADLTATADSAAAVSTRVGVIWFSAGGATIVVAFALVARLRIRARRIAAPRAATVVPVLIEA